MTELEATALRKIKSTLTACEKAGWSTPSIMVHDVDLKSIREVFGEEITLDSGIVEATMSTYITGTIEGYNGLTLFGKAAE